ncbi:MAG: molybdenum cofactor guanylyltransferase [bacterium]
MKIGWSGAVLAGGESRRFGRDKARAVLGDKELIAHVLQTLGEACDEVLIVTNEVRRFEDLGVPVVSDLIRGAGSLGGLLTALVHAEYDRCFVAGCDMPFLNARVILRMLERADAHEVVVATLRGEPQPLHAVYSRRCIPWIGKRIVQQDLCMFHFYPSASTLYLEEAFWKDLDPDHLSFMNINTPEQLREAEELLGRCERKHETRAEGGVAWPRRNECRNR